MNKAIVYGALLLALTAAAGISFTGGSVPDRTEPAEERRERHSASALAESHAVRTSTAGDDWRVVQLEQQLASLASKLAAESAARRHLEERLEMLTSEIAPVHVSSDQRSTATAPPIKSAAGAPSTDAAAGTVPYPESAAGGLTAMERALVAAGLDTQSATDIKRRRDQLTLSEISLQDLATREGWMNTPRFAGEMAEIDRQRTSIRDEIGDDAYDRYLAALNQPNRVAVDDVLLESPAAVAGFQAGDVVLRYGDTRIFAPGELVAATRGGVAGETVQVEISRAGQRLEVAVPRGPLGLRIAESRGDPAES